MDGDLGMDAEKERSDWTPSPLSEWSQAIDRCLQESDGEQAVQLAQVVLKRLPRHLPTYYRLLQAIWILRRWEEGEDWARRLLRADPGNELCWSLLAIAAEQRGQLAQARRFWQRAFEQVPYNRPIRAGMVRTHINRPNPLALNQACLASLYRLGGRWSRAVPLYRALLEQDATRLDYQCGLLESLWRTEARPEARRLAQRLTQEEPDLVLGWTIAADVGDEYDLALARAPLIALDESGEYALMRYAIPDRPAQRQIAVSPAELKLLSAATVS